MTKRTIITSIAAIALISGLTACDQQQTGSKMPTKSDEVRSGLESTAVDALFAPFNNEQSPGCAVAVDRDFKIIHKAAYGMGDFEQGVPLTPQSVFYAASVSKQVVAMAALLLAREDKIDLDEDIHTYIPEFQDYGTPMTVRQILQHISGIRDFFNLFMLAGTLDGMVITEDKIMTMLTRQKALNFTPGDKWAYSNSAYFLISQIVKRVDGRNLNDYAQEKIFKPLGMGNTRFQHNHLRPIKNKAHGHVKQDNGEWFIADSLLDVVGSGGMYTTVEDLITWDRNFYDNKIGTGQDMVDEMQTSGILNNGEKTDYGLALSLKPYKGLKRVSHGGSLSGYKAFLQRFPDQHFSVALLCNIGGLNPQKIANEISDIYLADAFKSDEVTASVGAGSIDEDATPQNSFDASGMDMRAFVGRYFNDEVNNSIAITLSDDRKGIKISVAPNFVFEPISHTQFQLKGTNSPFTLDFARDSDGAVTAVTYNGSRVMGVTFTRQ